MLADALRVQAMVVLRHGHWEAAQQALEEALSRSRAMPHPYAEAKALYVYGQLHAARGEPEQAREMYQAALDILHRLGERVYAARIERAGEVYSCLTKRITKCSAHPPHLTAPD